MSNTVKNKNKMNDTDYDATEAFFGVPIVSLEHFFQTRPQKRPFFTHPNYAIAGFF